MGKYVNLAVFAGSASRHLGEKIAKAMDISLGDVSISRFSDGEISIEVNENVRGKDVFVIQSTCTPVNDSLVELLLLVDTMRRSSAKRITAVIPYFGYARQDRRSYYRRVPISAKVVANVLSATQIDRILTMDLHADQIQGFFNLPIDNLYASKVILQDIQRAGFDQDVIVSPDVGGVVRARALATRLQDADLAIIDKRRPHPNQNEVMNIVGEVEGRNCFIVDDIIDTAGTMCRAADSLKQQGAKIVAAYGIHPVLSGTAVKRICESQLDEVVVCDTIPLSSEAKNSSIFRQISVSDLIAHAIARVNREESIRSLLET